MRAYIITDLGFGDGGKGILTDFLVRQFNASVVVRYNGGAQAGHNVVTSDGRQHTFSQFGSGSFVPGVKTYLSRHVIVHPSALLVEGAFLEHKGILDAFARIRISDQALIITPFHQAANHIRELARGEHRHGSCGVGVGEAVEDALMNRDDSVLAGDLANPSALRRKLQRIRERKRAQLLSFGLNAPKSEALSNEWQVFERDDVLEAWISTVARITELGLIVPDTVLQDWLHSSERVVFEGAQGVLLDQDVGFHPYTTWSRCTDANALDLLKDMAADAQTFKFGVMRSYAVRHGPGPLPTETDQLNTHVSEHNTKNEWQGSVRYGWFDAVLARYALSVTGKMDAILVTHMDILPRLKTWPCCTAYYGLNFNDSMIHADLSDGALKNFSLPRPLSLTLRTNFTQALLNVTTRLETCPPEENKVIEKIESLLGQTVTMISTGPTADHVKIINPIPS